ncbi:MAG: insulinase family protein [Deltaproteobacteria bacterium]|nr:insulinase family protein [Deltaproteobacteria bacterium]
MTTDDAKPLVRVLGNGVTAVCQENHHSRAVSLQVWVGVGSADEDAPAGESGLAHVLEHMLFKGTARRGVGEIAREIAAAGGEINAWTSFDNTVYYVVLASRYLETGLDVLVDAVQHAAFDPAELDRELEVVLEEIKRAQDIPARQVSNALFETAFTAHPYRRPVIGVESSVRALTRDQVYAFYRRHYRPERMTVVAVGDFDGDQALERIERSLAGFERGAGPAPPRPVEPVQSAQRVRLLNGETQESHLAFAWHIPAIDHADIPALDVLSVVLGHGESSQLSRAVRFRQRLVNEVYAYSYTPRDAGLMIVGAALHHDDLLRATGAILDEVSHLQHAAPPLREIEKAKTIIESDAVYQRETAQGLARKLGFYQSVLGDLKHEQLYYDAVRRIGADDVTRVAARYLTRDALSCLALLPNSAAQKYSEPQLAAATRQAPPSRRPLARPAAGRSGAVRVTLSSGARAIVVPDRTVPVVAYRVVWLAGQRVETAADAGLGTLTARLLTKGTTGRGALEIAHAVDAMAASLDGFSGRNTIGFYGDFLSRFADQGWDLVVDCARQPAFRDDDLARERHQMHEQIRAREDDLSGLAFRLFSRGLYRRHPYRLDPLGTHRSVDAIERAALQAYHARYCGPDRAVVVLAGDLDVDRALEMASAGFGAAPAAPTAAVPAPEREPQLAARRVARLVRDRAQAHLVVGTLGTTFDGADRYALEVLSNVLSGQSGRLFVELRERRSLAYAVSALSVEGVEPGYFAVYLGTSPEKVEAALAGIAEQLALVEREPPGAAEIDRAKRYLVGTHEIGLQRVGARASSMAFNEIYDVGYEAHLDYAARIEAVSVDDLVRLARERLDPERAVVAIVGPDGCGGPAANLEIDLDADP